MKTTEADIILDLCSKYKLSKYYNNHNLNSCPIFPRTNCEISPWNKAEQILNQHQIPKSNINIMVFRYTVEFILYIP